MTDKQIIERLKTDLDFERSKRKTLQAELKAKEQECEELKIYIESNEQQVKEVETLVMDNDRLINELDRLKQTLTEIKEIAKFSYRPYRVCGEYNNCCEIVAKILSKISECEVEE